MSTEKAPAPLPAVSTTKITITLPNDLLAVLDRGVLEHGHSSSSVLK